MEEQSLVVAVNNLLLPQFQVKRTVAVTKHRLIASSWIVVRGVILEKNGIMQFLKIAVPGYSGPCGRTVQRNLSKLYRKKKKNLKVD